MSYNLVNDNMPVRVTFLTGLPRSGKTFFSEYFVKTDTDGNLLIDDTLDCLVCLLKFKKIEQHTFNYLFEYNLKKICFEYTIGRRVNLRPMEQSNILNSRALKTILLNLNKANSLVEKEYLEGKFLLNNFVLLHSALAISPYLLDRFPSSSIINIFENPYSLFYSWLKSGYGSLDTYNKPRIALPIMIYDNFKLPIYCTNWEEEFLKNSDIERIINMIYILFKKDKFGYDSLQKKLRERVQFIHYKNIFINFNKLDFDLLNQTNIFRDRERYSQRKDDILKREYFFKDEEINRKEILSQLNKNLIKKLEFCHNIYQDWKTNELRLLHK